MIILTYMLQACILAHQPYEASTVVPLIDCLMRTHTKLASISKVYRSNMILNFHNKISRTEQKRTWGLVKFFGGWNSFVESAQFFTYKKFFCQSFYLWLLVTKFLTWDVTDQTLRWDHAWLSWVLTSRLRWLYSFIFILISLSLSLSLLFLFAFSCASQVFSLKSTNDMIN